jgi:S-DNA-T family DNA segregation ATPase FtsK/SpoIIIE
MNNKKFVIPQVKVDENEVNEVEKKSTAFKREPFVSSVFGTKVKDEITFSGAQFGNKGRQYDAFRDKEDRVIKDDYKDYITYRDNLYSEVKPEVKANNQPVRIVEEVLPKQTTIVYRSEESDTRIVEEFDNLHQNPAYNDIYIDIEDEDEIPPLSKYENTLAAAQRPVEVQKQTVQRPVETVQRPVETVQRPVETVQKPKPTAEKKSSEPALKTRGKYLAPPFSLLKKGKPIRQTDMSAVHYQREKIDSTLSEFSINGHVVHFTKGPAVTQFEVQLDPGVKVQKVKGIANNFMAALKAKSIRIQAPIPGKSTVGIEVPNTVTDLVLFGELLQDESFINDNNPMNVVLGLDLSGKPVFLNLAKMPHCLIGGTTGSGKSVCINSIIASIIYKAHPDDVKLILIDPKIIEFSNYEDMPHLATPIITEPKVATAALKWAVEEMQNRYQLFRTLRVREYEEYAKAAATNINVKHIPYIVIVIDELADLMLVSGNDVEDYIQRLTQKGRASGIHLIVATQRPSVDVIKGTIKTNIPTRIAFLVKTQVDSSIILDHSGAEKLLGHGDMLYNDSVSEQRLQGAYISSEEILAVTNYVRKNGDANFMFTQAELEEKLVNAELNDGINDEFFPIIARFVVENNSASINRIQKTFGVGFNRAQAIMQGLEDLGIVSENLGSRARTVEVNSDQLEGLLEDL